VGIFAALSGQDVETVLAEYGGKQFSEFKPALADLAVEMLAPIGTEMSRLLDAPEHLEAVLADGAARADAIASPVLAQVKEMVGFSA
jgi:tryptophanyl-tRNA synthetase